MLEKNDSVKFNLTVDVKMDLYHNIKQINSNVVNVFTFSCVFCLTKLTKVFSQLLKLLDTIEDVNVA